VLVPSVVKPDEARVHAETSDNGCRVGVLVDAESHGSAMLHGLEWIDVGSKPVTWTADDETHEVYYLISGRLRVSWHGGTADLEPGDSMYLPPDRTYMATNVGQEQVFLVWSAVPAPGCDEADR
jgi:mannose-6-phosphate isomerase-like protein (cupin superfamily)